MGKLTAFFALMFLALPVAAQDLPAKPGPAAAHLVTTAYFGVEVSDPYRYMENSEDPAGTAWINEQGRYARSVLDRIPGRADVLAELEAMEKSEPAPVERVVVMPGGRYFYLKQAPGRRSYNLYRRDGLSGKEVLLADPNEGGSGSNADSTVVFFSPSFDGAYVAYGTATAGNENLTLRVLNAETGKTLPDAIAGIALPSIAWLSDGHSFLYIRRGKAASGSAGGPSGEGVFRHSLGTDPSSDVAVFDAEMTPESKTATGRFVSVETAPGSNYAVAARKDAGNGSLTLYAASLAQIGKAALTWRRIGNDDVTILDYRLHGNELFLLVNGLSGPVIARVSLLNPGVDSWGLMLQLAPQESIAGMQAAADAVYLTMLNNGNASLVRLPYKSSEEIMREVLPFQGSVSLYDEDPRVEGALVKLSSWTRAPAIYRYDPQSDRVVGTDLWPSGPYDDPSDLVATSATVLGSDGTLVPLTILSRKGAQRDGTHPALVMGYGASASTPFPTFRPSWLVWLNRGGVLAFAHVASPTRIQDFLTCAQYLVNQGYTTSARLAAVGGNAGAILVGRAMTTEPDLFRAVAIESGWLDLLRLKNPSSGATGGRVLGNTKTLEGFRSLQSLSPYEHVERNVGYPAVLLEAGMNDARVPAWQSAKMAARLDADSTSGLPVLLSIEKNSTRALDAGPSRKTDLLADEFSFLLWQLGEPGFQPSQPAATASTKR